MQVDQEVLERIILLLDSEQDTTLKAHPLSAAALRKLLNAGTETADVTLQSRTFGLFRRLPTSTQAWKPFAFDEAVDSRLGELALRDGFEAREAARCIGHLRSSAAVKVILAAHQQRSPAAAQALRLIGLEARSLPPIVPPGLRMSILGEAVWRHMTQNAANLRLVLFTSLLAGIGGMAVHFYSVIRAPAFLNADRLLVAVERAVVGGPALGMAILLTRLIARRMTYPSRAAGLVTSLLAGTAGVAISFLFMDYLFLNEIPVGIGIGLGSLLFSAGFSLQPLLPVKAWWANALTSAAGIWLGIVATWLIYLSIGASPLFFYEDLWSLAQVMISAGVVSLIIGGIAYTVDLQ
jgi:hypothetical protein